MNNAYAVVLDTGALLAKYYNLLPRHRVALYTTFSNVEEVRDEENKTALLDAIENRVVTVIEPASDCVKEALNHAEESGELAKLSKTDVSVIALALCLKREGFNVVVLTDDYDVQNVLLRLNIGFKPLKSRGIREYRYYKVYCPVCGYVPGAPGETTCPVCGSKLVTVRARKGSSPPFL